MTAFGVLEGVRIVDLTQMLSGPFCTMLLADHGADVIKIEPFGGETTRGNGPYLSGDNDQTLGGYFQSVNRNKRSLVLDLRSGPGRKVLLDLVRQSDAIVSNFREGVMERLGLSYGELRAINPRIVQASISGFGSAAFGASPYGDWPAYDVVAQAMGGIMAITGSDPRTPVKVGPGVGDIFPGTLLAFAIVAALRHAERTGAGQRVEVAMYDAVVALCERAIYQYSYTGESPYPEGQTHPFLAPFGMFPAADGWIALAAQNNNFWALLADIMACPELKTEAGFATKAERTTNRNAVNQRVGAWTRRFTKVELKQLLGGKVPFGAVQTAAEIVNDPHLAARGLLAEVEEPGAGSGARARVVDTPIKFSRTPGGVRARGPLLGEHSDSILASLGYSAANIAALKAERFVG